MERWLDIAVEIMRIGNPRGLLREIRAAGMMFGDSFRENPPDPPSYCVTVIFVQGFFAKIDYYRRFVKFFNEHNVRVVHPLRHIPNTVSYNEARRLISDSIKRVEDETGKPPELAGHSKGGTDIIGVLGKHPEIGSAYLIAAPLRGRSLRSLNTFMRIFHGNQGIAVDYDILSDKAMLAKITTVSSNADRIVPTRESTLPGSRAKIVMNGGVAWSSWDSHTGLPYYARNALLRRILPQRERVEHAA